MCVQCAPAWPLLTFPLQTELNMNTHTMVADIHQNMLKNRKDTTDGQNLVVRGPAPFTSPNKHLPQLRLKAGQQS